MSLYRNPPPSDSLLKQLIYDPDTGIFVWSLEARIDRRGKRAGGLTRFGYWRIKLGGRLYFASRLAWLFVYGVWPSKDMDHIDGVKDNDRIENLREASPAENAQNLSARRTHTASGLLGVTWNKKENKWQAGIKYNNQLIYLGLHDTPTEAHLVYLARKRLLHTFNPSPRDGIPV